ncbi:unnamed protein product, partial [Ectocarpus sp. 12 AP-2014]
HAKIRIPSSTSEHDTLVYFPCVTVTCTPEVPGHQRVCATNQRCTIKAKGSAHSLAPCIELNQRTAGSTKAREDESVKDPNDLPAHHYSPSSSPIWSSSR